MPKHIGLLAINWQKDRFPPPRNHTFINRNVLMKITSSLKVRKKQFNQWLYFVQLLISWLSSMQIAQNLEEAIPGHHLTKACTFVSYFCCQYILVGLGQFDNSHGNVHSQESLKFFQGHIFPGPTISSSSPLPLCIQVCHY